MRRLAAKGWQPSGVLDVGAYKGTWTHVLQSVWPGTPTLMIEAQPSLLPNLQAVASELGPNVGVVHGVVSAVHGQPVTFYTPEYAGGTTGASIYPEQLGIPLRTSVMTTTTLDILARTWQGPAFNFIKLDIQGAEKDALMGASDVLKTVELLQLELSLVPYNRDAPQINELMAYLDGIGFVLYDLCDTHRGGDDTLYQMDTFFIRKDHWLRPGGTWMGARKG
ncbi:FkbM family methyltransferase [Azospirillum sp. TSO22-1]|uniref:FkbM family methyltransferase n=1 Tax=Azospirillum sp. TSO22-1 TaxID=716789 RepID=UPI0013047C98|nr:FkbM family methyltransferase [Azospirillum sp. TSO22-1]